MPVQAMAAVKIALFNACELIKGQARRARKDAGGLALVEVDQYAGMNPGACKKLGIHFDRPPVDKVKTERSIKFHRCNVYPVFRMDDYEFGTSLSLGKNTVVSIR